MVLALGLILIFWPLAAADRPTNNRISFREYHTSLGYLQENFPEQDNLIVFDTPSWYIPWGWGSVSFRYANAHKRQLLLDLRNHHYRNILVVQVIRYLNEKPALDSGSMHADVPLEVLFEARLNDEQYSRISRVKP